MSFSSDGVLSGTPKGSPKKYTMTLTASNSGGNSSIKVPLNVLLKPELSTKKLSAATEGKKYSAKLTAKGSVPINWNISGLPEGLECTILQNGTSATITGIPEETGTHNINITMSNAGGASDASLSLMVNGTAPKITASLGRGKAGEPYTASNISVTGTKPIEITYSISDKDKAQTGINTLEDLGLEFFADPDTGTAQITGIPSKSLKSLPITITANNGFAKSPVSRRLTMSITGTKPSFIYPNDNIINIVQETGTNINDIAFEVSGTPDMTFTMSKAAGFTLESSGNTAILSGTAPSKAGRTNITITASNSEGRITKKVIIQAMTPPSISTRELKSGTLNKTYSEKLSAQGSTAIEWRLEGSLPSGITFNKGAFSGKPSSSGIFPVRVTAANSVGTDIRDFTITIADTMKKAQPEVRTYASVPESLPVEHTSGNIQESHEEEAGENIIFGSVPSGKNYSRLEDDGYTVIAVLPEIRVEHSGMYDIEAALDDDAQKGAILNWFAFPKDAEDSDDDAIAEFYDMDGAEIEAVPEEREIIVSAWLEEGVIYEPVIAASSGK